MALIECGNCGAKISANAETCPKCGSKKETDITCWECGALLPSNHEGSCPECGEPEPKNKSVNFNQKEEQVSEDDVEKNESNAAQERIVDSEQTVTQKTDHVEMKLGDKLYGLEEQWGSDYLFTIENTSFPNSRIFFLLLWMTFETRYLVLPRWISLSIILVTVLWYTINWISRHRYIILKDKIVEYYLTFFKPATYLTSLPYEKIDYIDLGDGKFTIKHSWQNAASYEIYNGEFDKKELNKVVDLFEVHQKKGNLPASLLIKKPKAIRSRMLWGIANIILIIIFAFSGEPSFVSTFINELAK